MTTPTPSSGPKAGDAAAIAKAKAAAEAKKKKEKKKKKRKNKNKNNNNNNRTIHSGLMKDGIMKGITISVGTSAQMTTDYRLFNKSLIAYSAAKGYERWPGVIENMMPIEEKTWKTDRPDKNKYASKLTTKIKQDGGDNILKQEWIVTDCELELELEENYTNMLRQRLAEKSLFRKHGDLLYNIIFGQLHPDVIAAAKNSTTPLYTTVHTERDVVAVLSILLSVCVKNR